MKSLIVYLAVLITFTIITGCGENNKTAGEKTETGKNTEQNQDIAAGEEVVIRLPTMQCNMCKKTIEKDLKKLDGVNEVNVVVKEKVAKVTFDKSKTDVNSIEGVIVAAGYQANDKPANKEAYDKLDDCCKIGGH